MAVGEKWEMSGGNRAESGDGSWEQAMEGRDVGGAYKALELQLHLHAIVCSAADGGLAVHPSGGGHHNAAVPREDVRQRLLLSI